MKGLDPKIPFNYIVRDELTAPVSEQTVFKLKNLTVREMELLKNSLFAKHGQGENTVEKFLIGSQERQALELGLTGWENFKNQNGDEIPFNIENIDFIPPKHRNEIALAIRGENALSEDEGKN